MRRASIPLGGVFLLLVLAGCARPAVPDHDIGDDALNALRQQEGASMKIFYLQRHGAGNGGDLVCGYAGTPAAAKTMSSETFIYTAGRLEREGATPAAKFKHDLAQACPQLARGMPMVVVQ